MMVLSSLATVSSAEPIGANLGQMFEMTKAMATAPRLYSAENEQNPEIQRFDSTTVPC